ncbi:MAG: AprM [Parcubacteria group bacterium Athens1014_10]|nr:MAG: AprM [Parcubacteria group bacterium Athens1014_10]TSD04721.1 MAG: AprM [Parcubacteria group bacterium Athens0714_12]
MLIGIDVSRANREKKTGVEWYSYHLIENLKKMDEKSRYFLYSAEKLREDLGILPRNWQSKVLKWLPKFLWTQIRLSWEMLVNPPDLLFVPSHVIPFIHPKKTITTIHDIGFKKFPRAYSFFQRWYLDWSVKFALKYAAKIIAISQFTKEELIKIYQADEKKISVIPLAYNDEIYQPINNQEKVEQVLKKYQIKKPYLFYVGRLEEKKNISFLIDVFEVLSSQIQAPLNLVLAGGRGYGYERIKEKIARHKLNEKITQIGWLNENDLSCFYAGAEVFIFPSLYEGFGIPLLEAMACGTTIVASNSSSIPEIVGQAALLANPDNIQDFVGQIKRILGDKKLKENLKQKGLERIKNFSWQKCAQETLSLFNNIEVQPQYS